MQGLFLVILAAVASVHGTRYRGPRFIDLGITGVLRPVNAGYTRGALSRLDSFDRLTRTSISGPTFVSSGFSGGLTASLRSLDPLGGRRATEVRRTIAPLSGGIQTYEDIGLYNGLEGRLSREPYLGPDHGPYDGPDSGPYDGPNSGPYNGPEIGPYRGPESGPYRGPDSGPYDGADIGPYTGPEIGPYRGPDSEPYDGPDSGPYDGPDSGPYSEFSGPYSDSRGPYAGLRGDTFSDDGLGVRFGTGLTTVRTGRLTAFPSRVESTQYFTRRSQPYDGLRSSIRYSNIYPAHRSDRLYFNPYARLGSRHRFEFGTSDRGTFESALSGDNSDDFDLGGRSLAAAGSDFVRTAGSVGSSGKYTIKDPKLVPNF
ncbi:uncharacterized protein LOC125658528 [Ostrea edulis]|uniref:uncharacterized protein LOC125658528 n=1 Tax=Ostrea edulis TaxID=37623 RepID=UPI0024AF2703|nr:uncharacterized protein LOC125658528 [Ostrea edulis]